MPIIIIPARFASSRYPGKPLVQLRDRSGQDKTLIQRSWEAALTVRGASAVYVATDHEGIAETASAFGAQVLMTPVSARNGTERCAYALDHLTKEPDIVINFQGDALLTPPWFVESLIDAMLSAPGIEVATPVLRCDQETYENLLDDRCNGRVGATTAVFDRNGRALYFSKEVLPHISVPVSGPLPVFHHVGVYAFRPPALRAYLQMEAGTMELVEGLEQLRFMEHGVPVHCVEVEGRGRVFWELNNPVDVARIEAML